MSDFAEWLKKNPEPLLQARRDTNGNQIGPDGLIERAGRRLAARLGEPYDPMKLPGYPEITPEEHAEFDRARAEWQQRYRERHREGGAR